MGTWKVPSWPAAGICISLAHGDASTPPAPRGAPCPARETASSPPFSLVHFYKFLQYPCPFFFFWSGFGQFFDHCLVLFNHFGPTFFTDCSHSCPFLPFCDHFCCLDFAAFGPIFGRFWPICGELHRCSGFWWQYQPSAKKIS